MAMKGGFSAWRRAGGVLEGLVTTLVLVVLVTAAVYAATRPTTRVRIDLTARELYSLTDQTRKVLANLDTPIEFVFIHQLESVGNLANPVNQKLAEVQEEAFDYVLQILREYELASGGRARVRHLDYHADTVEVRALVDELRLAPRPNVVLVRGETRTLQVFLEELVTIDRGQADGSGNLRLPELVDLRAEGPLTSALLTASTEVQPRVGILSGVAGPRLDDFDLGGLGLFAEALRLQGFEVQSFELTSGAPVPPELDVVAIIGPQTRLSQGVVDALRQFHRDGGGLLLALDPESPQPPLEDLYVNAWLAELGLERGRYLVVRDDTIAQGPARAELPIYGFNAEHPISEPIARQGTVALMLACSPITRHRDAPSRVLTTRLAWTAEQVFGDRPEGQDSVYGDFTFDPADHEVRRSHWVGVAREPYEGDGGVVLFGTAKFLSNAGISQAGDANLSLGLNAANWLTGREDALAVRPRTLFESRIDLYEGEKKTISFYVVLVMPLFGALLGLVTWFVRRR